MPASLPGKGRAAGNLGPLPFGTDTDDTPSAGGAADPEGLLNTAAGATNMKIEGKAALKACLPPPPR